MEKPNARGANNFVVGLFVFIGLVVSAGFVVFMGGVSLMGGETHVYTVFRDVRGLNVGAPVFLSGMRIGRVSAIRFPNGNEKDAQRSDLIVQISIYTRNRDLVRTDSEASITTQGMLGDKVLVLSSGSADAAAVAPGATIPSRLPGELSDYLSKGGDVMENVNSAVRNLNALLERTNKSGNLDNTLANLEKVTHSLSGTHSTLGSLINGQNEDIAGSLRSLRSILGKIDRGEGTLGALVNDASLHEDLRVLLGGAQRSRMVRFLLRQAISNAESKEAVRQK